MTGGAAAGTAATSRIGNRRPNEGLRVRVPTGRRPRVSRSGLALAARGRASPLGPLLSAIVRLVGRRLARHRPRRAGHLRIARRDLHAGGHAGRHRSPLAAIGLAGRYGGRVDARGPVSRRPQLGLRRRLSLCRAEQLWRAAGTATFDRCGPSGRAGRHPGRGLQPSRPRRQLPGAFGPYFTDRYPTPWGTAVNYDGPDSDAVRQFVVDNACAWVRDFHVDGLRLDAVHAIYDLSPRHILAEIQAAVRREAARGQRIVHVIAESNPNDVRLGPSAIVAAATAWTASGATIFTTPSTPC